MSSKHFALYGRVKIERSYCHACRTWAFVEHGALACCGNTLDDSEPKFWHRMSVGKHRRTRPSIPRQREILAEQENRCLYCDREFGTFIERGKRVFMLTPQWDHMDPWNRSRDNHDGNFAAACRPCNGWKSNLCFETVAEVREFVARKWERSGYVES